MRRIKLQLLGHVKIKKDREDTKAAMDIKIEEKGDKGRPTLRRCEETVRKTQKAWKIKEEWTQNRKKRKRFCKIRHLVEENGVKRGERGEIILINSESN